MTPTVGRIVHYYDHPEGRDVETFGPGEPLAAIITAVHGEDCVSLSVFSWDGEPQGKTSICRSDDPAEGPRWCWPPRV